MSGERHVAQAFSDGGVQPTDSTPTPAPPKWATGGRIVTGPSDQARIADALEEIGNQKRIENLIALGKRRDAERALRYPRITFRNSPAAPATEGETE